MASPPRILYCHCAYARVIPEAVKEEVLRRLSESGRAFEAVTDLCEMSARRDPALARIAHTGPVRIAACYPRAVRWLFRAAGSPLDDKRTEIRNMRTESADETVNALLDPISPEGHKSEETDR